MSNEYKEWIDDMKYEEEQAKSKGMCPFCDDESSRNVIYQDSLTGDWYLDIQTNEWDDYDDDFVRLREYINFCPYCGRKL